MDQPLNIQEALDLHRAGRVAEAEQLYRQILEHHPTHPDALHLLGVLTGNPDLIRRAIQIQPQTADYHTNLGNILRGQNQLNAAIESYATAVRLRPDHPEFLNNLGNALREAHRLDEAVAIMTRAVALKPDMPESRYNLAMSLADAARPDEAIASFNQAIVLRRDYADAHANIGNCYREIAQPDQAIKSFRKALELKPSLRGAYANLLYTLHFHPGYNPQMILAEHRAWGRLHIHPTPPHDNDRNPDRPLRIGYVSPDFRDHVVGRNLIPLLRQHDHPNYQIICYSNNPTEDAFTKRMRSLADDWRNVFTTNDDDLAATIRRDRIDILVDLALHMAGNRLMLFARRPAPIQVTFAGYPGGTGLQTMDYRLTDPHLDPQSADADYVEKSIRLPHTFWCYDAEGMSLDSAPPVGPLPLSEQNHITFGCLNNSAKITDTTVDLWNKVLNALPNSRLILLSPTDSHRRRILTRLGERVDFVPRLPRIKYLDGYNSIDVSLDTFPYNGHTTSLDSFWMGVPVITHIGQTAVGRATWSQLCNLDLRDLAARTPDEFVSIAASLARDSARLTHLRSTLRDRMKASPLMDAPRFARSIEAAYRQMWRDWISR